MANEIIAGNAIEVMSNMEPGSVDLVVTSPPYPGQMGDTRGMGEWLQWLYLVIGRIRRVLTPTGVIALNVAFKRWHGWFDARLLTEIPTTLDFHGLRMIDVYIYGKTNAPPNGPLTYCDPPAWEPVFVATKAMRPGQYTFNPYREPHSAKSIMSDGTVYTSRNNGIAPHPEGARQNNLMLLSSSGDQNRPRAKGISFPLALAERFIRTFSNPGDLVLDPFVGAGTTARAAQTLGRRYVGIDIDVDEVEKARRWLEEPFPAPLFQEPDHA